MLNTVKEIKSYQGTYESKIKKLKTTVRELSGKTGKETNTAFALKGSECR